MAKTFDFLLFEMVLRPNHLENLKKLKEATEAMKL